MSGRPPDRWCMSGRDDVEIWLKDETQLKREVGGA
jgi:hypothetical protein